MRWSFLGVLAGIHLLFLSQAAAPVAGLEPEDLAERWRWRIFGREEGLPSGTIYSLGHDRDDYLYAGTDRGLHRYNGFVWAALEAAEPLQGGPVQRILESGGDVYAATSSEVWLARYGLDLRRILRGGRILLASGPLGGIYAVDTSLRSQHLLEKETASRVDEGAPLPESEILDYAIDERHFHWLATTEGPYRRDVRSRFPWQLDPVGPDLRGRPLRRLFVLRRSAVGRPGAGPIGASLSSPGPLDRGSPEAGGAAPGAPVSGALAPGALAPATLAPATLAPATLAPATLGPGSFELWGLFGPPGSRPPAGGPSLLAQRGEKGWQVVEVDPSHPAIQHLVVDGSGAYLAVSEAGSIHLSSDGISWKRVPQLGVGPVALAPELVDLHGYLWCRAGNASVLRFDGLSRRWEHFHQGLGLPSNNVLSLLEASDGAVWAGTQNGVYCYPRGVPGEPRVYQKIGESELKGITGLAEDRAGKVWISSSESFAGTFFFYEDTWHRYQPNEGVSREALGIAGQPIRRIVSDRGGDLWFLGASRSSAPPPSPDGGGPVDPPGYPLYRYSASIYTISTFRRLEVPYGPVNDLLQAQDRSYWFATQEGLFRAGADSSRFERFAQERRLRSTRIWAIAEGGDGALWITYDPSNASGVTRIHGGEVTTFDERDGLMSPNAWSVEASISPEGGSVWFGTDRGLIRFDGECWYNHPIASLDPQASQVWPIFIGGGGSHEGESVLAGTAGQGIYRFRREDRRRPRVSSLDLKRLPDGAIAFTWDGRDFKNETLPADLRFRARIDDQPWSEFGPARERRVSGLTPGEHLFHVEVRDLDGNANREKYSLRFLVPPQPAVSPPLLAAALAGALGALALAALIAIGIFKVRGRPSEKLPLEAAARLHAAFPGAVLLADGEGKIAIVAGRAPETLGLGPAAAASLRGQPLEILPVFQTPAGRRALEELRALGAVELEAAALPAGGDRQFRLRAFRVASTRAAAGAAPGLDRPGLDPQGTVILLEEVTRERRSAELRERSRRLEALQDLARRFSGELAGAAGDPRLAAAVEALRRFCGESPSSGGDPRRPLSLSSVLDRLVDTSAGNGALPIPPAIELDHSSQAGLWAVPGEPAGLELLLREVLRNAIEAQPSGGRLEVRLRNRRLDRDPGDLAPGPYVEVEVRDEGPGMPAREAERAFEPFHSTKPRDRANGLGLSVAYGIARAHRGDIRVVSALGAGTTVVILLPADTGA